MSALKPVTLSPWTDFQDRGSKIGRHKHDHRLNQASSSTDRVFQDESHNYPLGHADYKYSNSLNGAEALSDNQIIEEYRDMIEQHIDQRISVFFQQLIVCFETKLHFEVKGAEDQGASVKAIIMNQGGTSKKLTRQAAHSSTLPCLVAYDRQEWNAYEQKSKSGEEVKKPEGFIFLKGSHYYHMANSTLNMVRWVNDADREIDEKTGDSQLRDKALGLVNRASQGFLRPEKGLSEFVGLALEEIAKASLRLSEFEKYHQVRKVLQMYENRFLEVKKEIPKNDDLLHKLLNLSVVDKTNDAGAKEIVLNIRYKAIKDSQVGQASIIQKIDSVRREILGKVAGIGKRPPHFDAVFRTVLIEQSSYNDRTCLIKLLNFSPHDFYSKLDTNMKKNTFNKTRSKVIESVDLVKKLADEIKLDMRTLRTEEQYQRADITRKLRKMKGWGQKQLGENLKNYFTDQAASQSTISRIERREKLIDSKLAQQLSVVFGVDSGLFIPQFFYDEF